MELIDLNIQLPNMGYIISIYLFIINLITFIAFGIDKRKAKKGRWRIPEATLLGLSLIGGTLGGIMGMNLFRHKTQKKKFSIGMPLLLVINIYSIRFLYLHGIL